MILMRDFFALSIHGNSQKKSGISRRRFIEYTGAAGLGIGLSSVLPQSSLAKTGIKVASGAANPLGLAANT